MKGGFKKEEGWGLFDQSRIRPTSADSPQPAGLQ